MNDPYFPIEDEAAIEITKTQIKALKLVESGKFSALPEFLNIGEMLFGLESKTFGLSANDLKAIRQLLNFFNGLKTNKEELVRSVMIHLGIYLSHYDDKEVAAQSVSDITRLFFPDIIKQCEKSSKNYLHYTDKHLDKPSTVKTIFHATPVYRYQYSNGFDLIIEFIEVLFDGVAKMSHLKNDDGKLPDEFEINDFVMLKLVVKIMKELELTKEEARTLLGIFSMSNQQEGKFPSA